MEPVENMLRFVVVGCLGGTVVLSTVTAATTALDRAAEPERSSVRDQNGAASTNSPSAQAETPRTPREFFNAGTRQLQAKKLRESEAFLEGALASQDESLQAPALYNLGHVRFAQGIEELKKSASAKPTTTRGNAAAQQGADAIRQADSALASDDIQKMVDAYMRGRGVRKDLKSATAAVERALTLHRTALTRWERASGDFKGALEIRHSDADAEHNAEVVDRCIAKLVDSLKEMQQCANGMCDKGRELGEKLQKLKGRIPAPNMPPGAAGDEDDDEDFPFGPKPGQKEGPTKEGQQQQIALSPEQAGWLLDGFKLDSEHRLPMGQGQTGEPRDRSRPTW